MIALVDGLCVQGRGGIAQLVLRVRRRGLRQECRAALVDSSSSQIHISRRSRLSAKSVLGKRHRLKE